ncbi:unnamed protein product [Symbiodinium natans]|uniref:Uncharacterized protein n=1 Tax=Symbiodinium natans TaxID=878477 RepID=A0A812PKK8_9DINO|nr:unnamed protein product [Symbiodinium natans]
MRLTPDETKAARSMGSLLRRFILMSVCILAAFYATATMLFTRISIARSLVLCAMLGSGTALGFVYLETDSTLLWKVVHQSQFYRNVLQLARNDWVRAFSVGFAGILIPILLGPLGFMSPDQSASADRFTGAVRPLVDELHTWNWTSVLRKLNAFCALFILLLVGMKVTYVFFSWLNVQLIAWNLDITSLSILVFAIGLSMFMMPIVPGTAVYIFAGIVLGYQAQTGSQDLWRAIGIGILLSSVAKMLACTGQYLIGYCVGKSVRVQRFVAVDRVFTRAMEMILSRRGLSPGKVCILVAGPDFPTSVLCGILKLNIPQMLLGTTPVILVSIVPQVCVGALVASSPASSESDSSQADQNITQYVTAGAAVIQAAATLYVSYRIMKTAEDHYQELSKHRPEHDKVAELTKKEEAYTRKYAELTRWGDMSCLLRASILLSSGIFLLVSWIFAADFTLSNQMCFRTFSITDRIDADFEDGGLDGNVLNLVSHPVGTVTLVLSAVAFLLHILVGSWLDSATRRSLAVQVATESGGRQQPSFYDVLGRPSVPELS